MMIKKVLSFALLCAVASSLIPASVFAVVTPTFTLDNTSGDNVRVQINAEPLSSIKLSYLAQGSSSITTTDFGTTNSSGVFSTTISSGGYGIPQGSATYISVGGVQSTTKLWPSYTSILSLSQTSLQLSSNQSAVITGSHPLTIVSNSQSSVVSTSLNGAQLTVTARNNGSSVITVCGSGAGCGSITVTVGASTQTQVSLNTTSVSLSGGESKTIYAYGGSNTGYYVKSNSNTTVVEVYTAGTSNAISLYGGRTSGSASVVICAKSDSANCATLQVYNSVVQESALSFSLNNFTITKNETRTITVSGGFDNNYFISSNSLGNAAIASISGQTLTIVGGSQSGTANIVVCSASVSGRCGTVTVTLTSTTGTTTTALTFSQNVVSVSSGYTTVVTVSGGNTSSYVIGGNTNSSIVTPSIVSGSSSVNLYGSSVGSAIVTVCTSAAPQVCANIFVTVTTASTPVSTTESSVTLSPGGNKIISLTGTTSKTITSNSNPNLVSASLSSNGSVVILSAAQGTGSSSITICATNETNNCTTLYVYVSGTVTYPVPSTPSPVVTNPTLPTSETVYQLQYGRGFDPTGAKNAASNISTDKRLGGNSGTPLCTPNSLIRASTPAVYYCGTDGRRYVFPNSKTYSSWYSDFNSVIKISDSQLGSIPIGGNVMYRPGVRLIKITTDPKVYAVAPNGVLRWITSAILAQKYYGTGWNKIIDDVPDAFFTNYTIGSDIIE